MTVLYLGCKSAKRICEFRDPGAGEVISLSRALLIIIKCKSTLKRSAQNMSVWFE